MIPSKTLVLLFPLFSPCCFYFQFAAFWLHWQCR